MGFFYWNYVVDVVFGCCYVGVVKGFFVFGNFFGVGGCWVFWVFDIFVVDDVGGVFSVYYSYCCCWLGVDYVGVYVVVVYGEVSVVVVFVCN